MDDEYPYEKKKRLANKISKLKKKEDMIKILEIIYDDNKQNVSENQNGIFMLFHKLNITTYQKINSYLKSINKNNSNCNTTCSDQCITSDSSNIYSTNDSFDHDKLNHKIRYSNKEKNIIKRQRYDDHITSENNDNAGIIYKKFDTIL